MDNSQEIPETILDQLMQSKVNGFPFFAYTGIKAFNFEGNDTLYLKELPVNPNKITSVQISYDLARDSYKIYLFKNNQRTIPEVIHEDVYFDQMATVIAKGMGVQ